MEKRKINLIINKIYPQHLFASQEIFFIPIEKFHKHILFQVVFLDVSHLLNGKTRANNVRPLLD